MGIVPLVAGCEDASLCLDKLRYTYPALVNPKTGFPK